jgi:hypothetical protein
VTPALVNLRVDLGLVNLRGTENWLVTYTSLVL